MKRKEKVPKGTRRTPWFFIPERIEDGNRKPAHYVMYLKTGIWRTDRVPVGSVVKKAKGY